MQHYILSFSLSPRIPLTWKQLSLNSKCLGLWICAHDNKNSCPNILKQKQPDLACAAKKNLRGETALALLTELWNFDFSSFKQLLFGHLLVQYPLPVDTEECSSFSTMFQFSSPPKHPADMNAIGGTLVSSRDSRSTIVGKKNKGGKSQVSSTQPSKSTKQVSSPAPATTPATVLAHTSCTPISGTPAGTTHIGKQIHAAKLVFLAPSGKSKTKLPRERRFPTLKVSSNIQNTGAGVCH